MKSWHKGRQEPSTNIASNERKSVRATKAAIRTEDHLANRDVRDWRDERKREGGFGD